LVSIFIQECQVGPSVFFNFNNLVLIIKFRETDQ